MIGMNVVVMAGPRVETGARARTASPRVAIRAVVTRIGVAEPPKAVEIVDRTQLSSGKTRS
tara:strand:- start:553 stop:735 length:183 start_codon:yes stop_codon:yes gene_type:complete